MGTASGWNHAVQNMATNHTFYSGDSDFMLFTKFVMTHLSITNLTVSYQTCSEWFHLPLWKLAMGTVACWSHPGPKSLEVS